MPLGLVLVIVGGTVRARIAPSVYALSLTGLFGASALYHRINWRSVSIRDLMRRLTTLDDLPDRGRLHAVRDARSPRPIATAILVAVWTGALLGVAFNLAWSSAPAWLHAALCVSLGWVAVAALPQLGGAIGIGAMTLRASAVFSTRWEPSSTQSTAQIRCHPCSDITTSSTPS